MQEPPPGFRSSRGEVFAQISCHRSRDGNPPRHRSAQSTRRPCFSRSPPIAALRQRLVVRGHHEDRALAAREFQHQREFGHADAAIGSAGPKAFYEKTVGAVVIEGSSPGIYAGMLRAGLE